MGNTSYNTSENYFRAVRVGNIGTNGTGANNGITDIIPTNTQSDGANESWCLLRLTAIYCWGNNNFGATAMGGTTGYVASGYPVAPTSTTYSSG